MGCILTLLLVLVLLVVLLGVVEAVMPGRAIEGAHHPEFLTPQGLDLKLECQGVPDA